MAMTPEQRRLRAKTAANARWAREDGTAQNRRMQEGYLNKLADEIDPERQLPQDERRRRAIQARKAQAQAAALKSSRVRAERAGKGKSTG